MENRIATKQLGLKLFWAGRQIIIPLFGRVGPLCRIR